MFNKKNDVNGQAEKLIYTENQDNDGQTQHTEQTMELFAAVRAELQTVSALVKDNHSFSETTPSYHSENYNLNFKNTNYKTLQTYNSETCYNKFLAHFNLPLIPHDQTIGSFLKHLQQYNFIHNTIFSINTKINEAYIY